MSPSEPVEKTTTLEGQVIPWKCTVCGFIFNGPAPPRGCPRCTSSSGEFLPGEPWTQLVYDGEQFDILLINGSTHRSHNTGFIAEVAEKELQVRNVRYRRYNLTDHKIEPCWCCYSMRAESCGYPCRNNMDDMPAFHEMIAASRAVIVISPINWNAMSVRLKTFLDRTTCMENLFHLKRPGLTEGKVVGIFVVGHEDGALKTAMDIHLHFEQMGFLLAPFGIGFRTHGSEFNSSTDAEFLRSDDFLAGQVKGVVNNVIAMMEMDLESKLKGKLVPVTE